MTATRTDTLIDIITDLTWRWHARQIPAMQWQWSVGEQATATQLAQLRDISTASYASTYRERTPAEQRAALRAQVAQIMTA